MSERLDGRTNNKQASERASERRSKVMAEYIYVNWDNGVPIDENVANYCNYRGCYLKNGVVALENLK